MTDTTNAPDSPDEHIALPPLKADLCIRVENQGETGYVNLAHARLYARQAVRMSQGLPAQAPMTMGTAINFMKLALTDFLDHYPATPPVAQAPTSKKTMSVTLGKIKAFKDGYDSMRPDLPRGVLSNGEMRCIEAGLRAVFDLLQSEGV